MILLRIEFKRLSSRVVLTGLPRPCLFVCVFNWTKEIKRGNHTEFSDLLRSEVISSRWRVKHSNICSTSWYWIWTEKGSSSSKLCVMFISISSTSWIFGFFEETRLVNRKKKKGREKK